MLVNASKLRENIYKLLDSVLKTGRPLEIERHGKRLRIVPVEPVSKLARLEKHKVYSGDPESFVHLDWSQEWESMQK